MGSRGVERGQRKGHLLEARETESIQNTERRSVVWDHNSEWRSGVRDEALEAGVGSGVATLKSLNFILRAVRSRMVLSREVT